MSKRLEEKLDKIAENTEKILKTLSAMLGRMGEVKILREENGVQLVKNYDIYGSYAVIDMDTGEVYAYKSKRRAERVYNYVLKSKG